MVANVLEAASTLGPLGIGLTLVLIDATMAIISQIVMVLSDGEYAGKELREMIRSCLKTMKQKVVSRRSLAHVTRVCM